MESFEDIRKKHIDNLAEELIAGGRRMIELGMSREEVLAHMTQLLNEPTGTAAKDHDVAKEES